jgi:hypothetical protein
MNPLYMDCVQGDANWFKCRLGCVTSSRLADVIAKLKRKEGEAACRRDMRWEIVCEMLTQKPTENYVSRWMKEGTEKEPLARAEYEIRNNCSVAQVGFIYHPTIKMAGASPDGLVGNSGLVEFKCPRIETHLQYLIDGVIPEDYIPQIIWQLACDPDREWVDFVSYHPEVPEDYQVFQKRLNRTKEVQALIGAYELEVEQFLKECEGTLEKLKGRNKEALQEAIA